MSLIRIDQLGFGDSPSLGAFGWLRTAEPQYVFDAQMTYDLQPLLFEQITNGAGATITHDTTNRCALMTFSSTPSGGKAYMCQYEHNPYQPGRGLAALVTFNFEGGVANCLKFAGYSFNAENGVEFQLNGTTPRVALYSNTANGDQFVDIGSWNGNDAAWLQTNLDVTKTQILALDMEALYVGRVRIFFKINGKYYHAHSFEHANSAAVPYIQTANLPIRCGMTCTGTVSTTMRFICNTVISEGGQQDAQGFHFSTTASLTAGNGTRTHALSIQPKTTFNSIVNRTRIVIESIEALVTGTNPIIVEACYGQALTTASFADVNATYSAVQVDTAGTLSGSPAIVADTNFVAASASNRQAGSFAVPTKYPITLNEAGAARDLGRLTVLATGVGGTSGCRIAVNWKEVR